MTSYHVTCHVTVVSHASSSSKRKEKKIVSVQVSHNNIRKRGKVKKATEFVERIIKVHEEVGVALKKAQEDMKRQVDRRRKESKDWKKENKVMLSTKDLVFKERPVRKLVERYVGPYKIEEVVLTNAIKL